MAGKTGENNAVVRFLRYDDYGFQLVPLTMGQMADELSSAELFFEVKTPLGFRVRVSKAYWDLIVSIKHPVMLGREEDVKETLIHPEEVRQSRSDENVFLFYRTQNANRWVCAVTKRLDDEGFLITAYPTDSIKEGVRIWPK